MPTTEETTMDDYAFEDGPPEMTWREVFATLIPRRFRRQR